MASQGIVSLSEAASAHWSCCKKPSFSFLHLLDVWTARLACQRGRGEVGHLPHLLPLAPSLCTAQPAGSFALLGRKTNLCSQSQVSVFCWLDYKSLFETLSQTKELIHFKSWSVKEKPSLPFLSSSCSSTLVSPNSDIFKYEKCPMSEDIT